MNNNGSFKAVIKKIVDYTDRVSVILLAGLILLIFTHILSRSLFRAPIVFTYDFVICFTVVVVSFALPRCAFERGHTAIDFIVEKFPQKMKKNVDIAMSLFVMVIFATFTYHMLTRAYSMFLIGEKTMTIGVPLYPFMYAMGLGFILLCLVLLFLTIERIKGE